MIGRYEYVTGEFPWAWKDAVEKFLNDRGKEGYTLKNTTYLTGPNRMYFVMQRWVNDEAPRS